MAAAGSSDPPKVEAAAAAAAAAGGGERADDVGRRGDQVSLGGGVQKKAKRERLCTAKERISRMPPCAAGKRSSIYRGVTRHRWTGRYEAHLWDKSTWNQNQNKKGKQVYLGAYDDEEAAARAYDLAALKYWGAGTLINFPVTDYTRDLEEMQIVTKEDYLVSLRRKSSAFSRGLTKYRGVTSLRQTQGRWETSYGQLTGNDYFNNLNCSTSRDPSTQGKLAVGFGMERKIDLTSYIRWWGPKKTRQVDSTSSTTAEDVSRELRALECSTQATEPYQLPSLGFSSIKGKHAPLQQSHSLSACSILSQSAAFKNLLVKSSETREDISNKERDRAEGLPEMFAGSGGLDSSGISILGMDQFHGQRTPYTLAPLLAGELTTSWNPVDPVLPADPALWASLVPPTGQQSLGTTAIKNEISSTAYTSYQCQD